MSSVRAYEPSLCQVFRVGERGVPMSSVLRKRSPYVKCLEKEKSLRQVCGRRRSPYVKCAEIGEPSISSVLRKRSLYLK